MAAPALKRINFIMLGVKNLQKSLAFYRDQLRLTVKSETAGLAFIDTGAVTLVLSTALGGTRPSRLAGATEIVFGVESVRAMYEELLGQDVKFITEPHQVSATDWAAAFRDPDGHAISIFGPRV